MIRGGAGAWQVSLYPTEFDRSPVGLVTCTATESVTVPPLMNVDTLCCTVRLCAPVPEKTTVWTDWSPAVQWNWTVTGPTGTEIVAA